MNMITWWQLLTANKFVCPNLRVFIIFHDFTKVNIYSKDYVDIMLWIINNFQDNYSLICRLHPPGTAAKKWNESDFRQPLCTYRLNWARRTSWGWWDDWDDTVLQTQDSKFEPWRSEAEHATSRSRRLPTILTFTRGWGRNIFVSFKPPRPGTEPRTLAWKAAVLTTTLGPPPRHCGMHVTLSADWSLAVGRLHTHHNTSSHSHSHKCFRSLQWK